ncbi:MBL fold metallo-hydrolase [Nonomuraea rubra]|uniref:MBL fold metallo-hydrolase n=1 Tax=Nonomuraea rubra TaxID=46180 RepID=UPI0033CD80C5
MTVLGGCGAWPGAGQACSGYLVEDEGFRVLIDPGYATLPRLLALMGAADVDAVLVTHGHPDHCSDLNPLLRARALADDPAPPLPVHAPPGALDAVMALDKPRMLAAALTIHDLRPGRPCELGPSTELVSLAKDADLLLAEATYPERVPEEDAPYLSSARDAGRTAASAGAARLLLTHLWPDTPAEPALAAAAASYPGALSVATAGLTVDLA